MVDWSWTVPVPVFEYLRKGGPVSVPVSSNMDEKPDQTGLPSTNVLKYWCFAFRGASQHNYARECAEVLLKWKYEMHGALRKALERSWFVNRWGLDGHWIATDLYLEQLNYWVKVSIGI